MVARTRRLLVIRVVLLAWLTAAGSVWLASAFLRIGFYSQLDWNLEVADGQVRVWHPVRAAISLMPSRGVGPTRLWPHVWLREGHNPWCWGFEFRRDQDTEFCRVAVPLWATLTAVFIAVVPFAAADRRRKRLRVGLCPSCGYDRRGLAVGVKCPECGTPTPTVPAP